MTTEIALFIYFVVSFIGFLICAYILKAIFGMKSMLNHIRNQTLNLKLMRKLAEETALMNGISKERIDEMRSELDKEYYDIENI